MEKTFYIHSCFTRETNLLTMDAAIDECNPILSMIGKERGMLLISRHIDDLKGKFSSKNYVSKFNLSAWFDDNDEKTKIALNALATLSGHYQKKLDEDKEIEVAAQVSMKATIDQIKFFDYESCEADYLSLIDICNQTDGALNTEIKNSRNSYFMTLEIAYQKRNAFNRAYCQFLDNLESKLGEEKGFKFNTCHSGRNIHAVASDHFKLGRITRNVGETLCSPKKDLNNFGNQFNEGYVTCPQCLQKLVKILKSK
jgi:hypothetical protein